MSDDVSKRMTEAINSLDEALLSGIEKACQLVENRAKVNCPVDDGILRASISHYVSPFLMMGFIGTNMIYAPYVHEGTGIYATNGNGRKEVPWTYQDYKGAWHTTKGQKPNPFLRNALDQSINDIVKILGEGARAEWMR